LKKRHEDAEGEEDLTGLVDVKELYSNEM